MTQRKQTTVDAADSMVTVGLLLVGVAVWILWGFPAMLAYTGTVLVLFGMVFAMQRGRNNG